MAWGTPSTLGSVSSTTGAQTINITSITAAAGLLVVVSASVIRGSDITFTISDSAGNTWTKIENFQSGAGINGVLAWSYITNALSGGTITVAISGGINWTAVTAGASGVTGAASSSTEDTAAHTSVNAAATTTPTITSGTPANSGDIFFYTYANAGSTADTYTEAGSWSNLFAKSGSTTATFSQGYQVNAGSGTLTHQPTTTSRGYVQCVMAFKVASGAVNNQVTLSPASFAFAPTTLSAKTTRPITLSPTSFAFSPQTITAATTRKATLSPTSFSFTPQSLLAKTTRQVTLTRASFAFSIGDLTAAYTPGGSAVTYNVTLSPVAFSFTPSNLEASYTDNTPADTTSGGKGGYGGGDLYYYKKRKKAPLKERAEEVKEAFEQLQALVPATASVYVEKAERKAELAVEKIEALKSIDETYAPLIAQAERAIEIFQSRLKAQAEEDDEEEIALIMAALEE